MACNGEDRGQNQDDMAPDDILKNYEQMIADDLKRIEEQGGEHADQLKTSLYEKWVPELLDTISMLCKTTSELEQVSTSAVMQLDHKLQESASATHAFMHCSAEMEESFMKNSLYSNSRLNMGQTQSYAIESDAEGNAVLPLQQQLSETRQALDECRARCHNLEKTISRLEGELKELQQQLEKREHQIDELLRNQPQDAVLQDDEKARLEKQIADKDAELQKVVAQKRLFEKRACDREDKIKALTLEVAAKHDAACQLEERLKQSQQRDDQHQMQLNYQSMLLEALRKEIRSYKKNNSQNDKNCGGDDKSTSAKQQCEEQQKKPEAAGSSTEGQAKELVRLRRRMEELEMMLRAKDEMISRMTVETAPSRFQARIAAIHQMNPEELKMTLMSKEKEMEEQRELIGQLQDALVASKHKLEELQRGAGGNGDASSQDSKDAMIVSLQHDLAEMEIQYAECFEEVCKQSQQLQLLREANQEHQARSKGAAQGSHGQVCARSSSYVNDAAMLTLNIDDCEHGFQEVAKAGNQLADIECELAFAKAQLSIYKTKNSELEDEIHKMKTTKTSAEDELEKILAEKNNCISEKNNMILELQEKLSVSDLTIFEEITNLQTCISDGATILHDKDLQITLLQEKLEEICNEAEHQLKLLASRDVALAKLVISLDKVSGERDALLTKIESLEAQQNSDTQNLTASGIASSQVEKSRESSTERRTKSALLDEIRNLQKQLQVSKEELNAWKQRYEVINTNLVAKENKIDKLKTQLEESKIDSQSHAAASQKLQEAEKQICDLRCQLLESETQLQGLRSSCEDKEQTIAALREELKLERQSAELQKLEDGQKLSAGEKKRSEMDEEMMELKSNYQTKEQQLEERYKEKEVEMQRLISISCENVQGLQEVNSELLKKLEISEAKVANLNEELVREVRVKCEKLDELAEARRELESLSSSSGSLQDQLRAAEKEVRDTKEQLSKFERELVLSSERVLQLQVFLGQAQEDKQAVTAQLVEARSQLSTQALAQQQQVAEMSVQLQSVAVEKQHLERSQLRLEEMVKSLTAQVGGQRCERDRAVRGLRQAAAERARLCQEARQVLAVARQWLAEHRAGALELQQLRADRERLLKENAALRHRRHASTSILNPWDCGLVDREESGFWSSHWTTQLEEVDNEIEGLRLRDEEWPEDEAEEAGCRGDTGYQSGSSK